MADYVYTKRILLVDEKPYKRRLARKILSSDDYLIVEASEGSDAVREVSRDFFDLVLMSDRMSLICLYCTRTMEMR